MLFNQYDESMARLTLEKLVAHARQAVMDSSALRAKERLLQMVLNNEHAIEIPSPMASRAFPVKSGIAREKVNRAKTLVVNDKGIKFRVLREGDTTTASDQRQIVQSVLQSIVRHYDCKWSYSLQDKVAEDTFVRSRGGIRAMPAPGLFAGMPEPEYAADEIAWQEPDEAKKIAARSAAKQTEFMRKAGPPLLIEWIPGETIIDTADDVRGPKFVLEARQMTVREVLDRWVDADGKPLAKALAKEVQDDPLTYAHRCTVVTYTDRKCYAVAVVAGVLLDTDSSLYDDASYNYGTTDEMLIYQEHNLGVVPIALFWGRQTTEMALHRKYLGLIDPILDLCIRYDYLHTQLTSAARSVAWPMMFLYSDPEQAAGAGAADRPKTIDIQEGGIYVLDPGDRVESPLMVNSQHFQILSDSLDRIRAQIDMHTLTGAAYGASKAPSGYLQAQLMEATTEGALEPFQVGLANGYTRLAHLILIALKAVMDELDLDGIPVRAVQRDTRKWVTVTRAMCEVDWEITADLKFRPVGGKMAEAQYIEKMLQLGLMDLEGAMASLDEDEPQLMKARVRQDKLLADPAITQMAIAAIQQRILPALQEAIAPGIGGNPQIPGALASVTTDPSLQARLPDALMNNPTGALGTPGPLSGMAPPAPNPHASDVAAVSSLSGGGNPATESLANPGGVNRMSDINSRFAA